MSVVAKLSVSVVISRLEGKTQKFLIVREVQDGQIVYNFPSGHIEAGESPSEAAIRELLEETGYQCSDLEFKNTYVLNGRKNENVYVSFLFSGTKYCKVQEPKDKEIVEALWLSRKQIIAVRKSWRNDLLKDKMASTMYLGRSSLNYS